VGNKNFEGDWGGDLKGEKGKGRKKKKKKVG